MHTPDLIISGMQTGVDIGAIKAAVALGIPTSGWMPRNFKTEKGFRPWYKYKYNAIEHELPEYPPRTEKNVVTADATLLISMEGAPERGTTLTQDLCVKHGKPALRITIPGVFIMSRDPHYIHVVREFIKDRKPSVLNIAGNRESISPGIEEWTFAFIRNIWLDWL